MFSKKALTLFALFLGLFLTSRSAHACGDYCDWGGLFNTTGYLGYGLGTSMTDIYSYTSTSISISYEEYGGGYSGGCGSFYGGCGGYTPSCGGFGYSDPYGPSTYGDVYGMGGPGMGGMNPFMNPASFNGMGSFMDPMTQMMMMTTLGMTPTMPMPIGPMTSMMPPQFFPPMQPPTMGPPSLIPQFYNPIGYPPAMPPTITPYQQPTVPFGSPVPPVNNPGPSTPPISQPPTNPLPWGGCDNIVVMCPGGPTERPPTVTPPPTPMSPPTPPITGNPQYQTVPTDPTRYQIPRGTHGVGVRR